MLSQYNASMPMQFPFGVYGLHCPHMYIATFMISTEHVPRSGHRVCEQPRLLVMHVTMALHCCAAR